MRIDLHTHSTSSDGTDSPTRLMMKAAGSGLDVVALTDHCHRSDCIPVRVAKDQLRGVVTRLRVADCRGDHTF